MGSKRLNKISFRKKPKVRWGKRFLRDLVMGALVVAFIQYFAPMVPQIKKMSEMPQTVAVYAAESAGERTMAAYAPETASEQTLAVYAPASSSEYMPDIP